MHHHKAATRPSKNADAFASAMVLHRVRDTHLNHFARNCPIALSQFSMWKVREILPS